MAGDQEMDALFDAYLTSAVIPEIAKGITMKDMGWWASVMTGWNAVSRNSSPVESLKRCRAPVLVMRGDADYLPEEFAAQYLRTFPNAKLVRVENSGHFIWHDQPAAYRDASEAFLR